MNIRQAVLMMSLLAPLAGYSANWVKFPISSIEGSVYFLDTDSAQRQGPYLSLWERLVLNLPRTEPTLGTFQSALFRMSYDCRRQSAALLESRFYRDAASQEEISNHIRRRPQYRFIVPDTPAAMKLEEACKLSRRR